jgi:hypothetical protein
VTYARLVDFDNDGKPELLYAYYPAKEPLLYICVYGYTGEGEITNYFTGVSAFASTGPNYFDIVTGERGEKYLHESFAHFSGIYDWYYTIKEGKFNKVLDISVSLNDDRDTITIKVYENENLLKEEISDYHEGYFEEYIKIHDNAVKTILGTVEYSEEYWYDWVRKYSTVYAVLAELAEGINSD